MSMEQDLPPNAKWTPREILEQWRREGTLCAWADRTDLGDSSTFARRLREAAQYEFGVFGGEPQPTEAHFRTAEFHGDPDDGLNWQRAASHE